jgi:hypothetical protein
MDSTVIAHVPVLTYWHTVCVDVVRALLIINRLKFEARVIIWQNVGETILGAIATHVCSLPWLLSANVFQLLKVFRELEI